MNPTIRTESLSKRFGRTTAVDSVSLDVPESAIYALVGANGAGKTTLIKLLMNILRPTAGSAQVLGMDSAALHRLRLRKPGTARRHDSRRHARLLPPLLSHLGS
jgi:ABC-2 type transport system ATP-binding protein